MSSDLKVAKVFEKVTYFWIDAAKRWDSVRAKVKAQPPQPYTADNFTTDVAAFWVNASDAWLALYPSIGEPVLPSALFSAKKGGGFKQDVTVDLASEIPAGASLTSTDIGQVGGTAQIPASSVVLSGAGTSQLNVSITFPALSNEGLYLGMVSAGSNPLATIAVVVVP